MMKKLLSLSIIVILTACGQKQQEDNHNHDHAHDAPAGSPNEALKNEVDKIHDEAMSKMDDIFQAKTALQKKLTTPEGMAEDKRKEIEATIAQLDSADQNMRKWMRAYNPPPDSLGEERAREYLEDEMEKVKKVKEDMLEALEDADKSGA